MKYLLFLLLFGVQAGYGIEVRTQPPVASDRPHYPLYAERMRQTVLQHPPVSDCAVLLHDTQASGLIDRVEVIIHIDEARLHEYFQTHGIKSKDEARYLQQLRSAIHKSAENLFSEVKPTSIHVELKVNA
jgi:hypothetical protein